MKKKKAKQLNSREDLPEPPCDAFLYKDLHQHARHGGCYFLSSSLPFLPLQGEAAAHTLVNEQIDGHKRLWVASPTCTGTELQFWLVDFEKTLFRGGRRYVY